MIKNILLVTILSLGSTAFAKTKTMVFMQGNSVNGTEMFRIKAKVKQRLMNQGENPADYQLEGVTLVAKTLYRGAQATLIVGQDQETKRIKRDKSFGDFILDKDESYETLNWNLGDRPGNMDERWQMRIQGTVKVRAMRVHLRTKTQRIRIPMNQLFEGPNSIAIRHQLRNMGYRPKNMKLRKVILVAKSKRGRGKAQLTVGNKTKPMKTVGLAQSGLGFQSDRPVSFNRVQWKAKGPTQGAWRMNLKGRIKVKAIIVEVQ